jgi:hypothetical protein
MTPLARCRPQTSFSLRQQGTNYFPLFVFSLAERKTNNNKKIKNRSAEGSITD